MRLSSIRVDTKSSDTVHKETEKKKGMETQRKRPWEDRGRDKMKPQAKEHQKPPEQEEARKDYPPGFSDGAWPYQHLDLGCLTPWTCKRINLCSFGPPVLGYFVMAAVGCSYTGLTSAFERRDSKGKTKSVRGWGGFTSRLHSAPASPANLPFSTISVSRIKSWGWMSH